LSEAGDEFERRDRRTGEAKWAATRVDLVFGSNSQLRAKEMFHAMKFFNYLQDQGATVQMRPVAAPEFKETAVKDLFQHVLEHEKGVTNNPLFNPLHRGRRQMRGACCARSGLPGRQSLLEPVRAIPGKAGRGPCVLETNIPYGLNEACGAGI